MSTSRTCIPPLPSKRPLSHIKTEGSTEKHLNLHLHPRKDLEDIENQNPNGGRKKMSKPRGNDVPTHNGSRVEELLEPRSFESKEIQDHLSSSCKHMKINRSQTASIRIPGMRSNILSEVTEVRDNKAGKIKDATKHETNQTSSKDKNELMERNTTDRRERRDFVSRAKRKNKLLSSRLKGMKGDFARVPVSSDVDDNIDNRSVVDDLFEDNLSKSSRIPKLDIRYMLDWDPNAPRSKRKETFVRPQLSHDDMRDPYLTPSSSQASSHNSSQTTGQRHQTTISSQVSSQVSSQNSSQNIDKRKSSSSTSSSPLSTCKTLSSQKDTVQSQEDKSNCDFLPIASEKNMIYVNCVPYSKLGVIGKGGSCKVYRTLSKDRNIVAIKKVKLGEMKKKAIEGYANEIALLRRLRGNPAIIHMYDSQVDLERKAIYLVMEVGEADLNHVLQSQRLANGSLNMNFIRLTWQQMLAAVNCIHEERIIHSDLKPANFLFVKGVLKLIDFGIAKAIQTDDTTNIYRESQVGTLNYMSPESIIDTGTGVNGARMKCGKPSDVWSLGCILYQMCYRRTPFADIQNMFQKMKAIVDPSYEIRFENTVNSAAIDAMKLCLQRNPADRAVIVGESGLLNKHCFLHAER